MKISKQLILCTLTGCLSLTGHITFAHDEIKSSALEGLQDDNAIKINHGCEAKEKPIRAQSVVFPTLNPELIASDNSTVASLSAVIDQGKLAGLVDAIQDKNTFERQDKKYDSLGNAIGFYGKQGKLQTNLMGRVPFQFTAPNFVNSSCARSLLIEVAIADICVLSGPAIRADKVNLWIPDNGSQYAALGKAQDVEGIGDPPVLKIERDLVNNPLAQACGAGFDVTVRPSAADIDANLGIPGWHF